MKQVYIAGSPAEAELICQRLLAEGLNAVVQGNPSPADGFSSVWVSTEDAERAHAVLADQAYRADRGEDEPD